MMKKSVQALITLAAVAATTGADAKTRDSFDLICTGNTIMQSWEYVNYGPSTIRVRVNLKQGKYCLADCKEVAAIAQATPEQLVFYDTSQGQDYTKGYFDRTKNTLVQIKGHRQSETNVNDFAFESRFSGNCKTARFSGFPKV